MIHIFTHLLCSHYFEEHVVILGQKKGLSFSYNFAKLLQTPQSVKLLRNNVSKGHCRKKKWAGTWCHVILARDGPKILKRWSLYNALKQAWNASQMVELLLNGEYPSWTFYCWTMIAQKWEERRITDKLTHTRNNLSRRPFPPGRR